jgi:hypothetical protein
MSYRRRSQRSFYCRRVVVGCHHPNILAFSAHSKLASHILEENNMKTIRMIFMAAVMFFACAGLSANAYAQCRTCEAVPGNCHRCIDGGPTGWDFCKIFSCFNCVVYGTEFCGGPSLTAQNDLPRLTLKFDEETIRQIAAIEPRFAATLAIINQHGGLTGRAKFHWSPVKIESKDVGRWLRPERESAAFFKRFEERARHLSEKGMPQVVYEIALEETTDSSLATVSLQVVKGSALDLKHPSLMISFVKSESSDVGKSDWVALQWRIDGTDRSKNRNVHALLK